MDSRWRRRAARVSEGGVVRDPWNISTLSTGSFTPLGRAFIERLWRSLKYEAVYLHELADGFAAQRVIDDWMEYYNEVRPHSALAGRTPGEAYRDGGTELEKEVA